MQEDHRANGRLSHRREQGWSRYRIHYQYKDSLQEKKIRDRRRSIGDQAIHLCPETRPRRGSEMFHQKLYRQRLHG